MNLFYYPEFNTDDPNISLSVSESKHITKVLRKKVGEEISLTDGKGICIKAKIIENHLPQTMIQITHFEKIPFPSENNITVGISVIRPNRMDWAVEKLTELGVKNIVPLICQFTVVNKIKLNHLKKITISALKQSGQYHLPGITEPKSFTNWLGEIRHLDGLKFIATLETETTFNNIWHLNKSNDIFITIGPEGGFHQNEIKKAIEHQHVPIKINSTILRTETAAVVAVDRLKLMKGLIFS